MPPTAPSDAAAPRPLRVWDLPTRLFHWSLAVAVVALIATAKTGAMDWHFRLGYTTLALLLFRLLWGLVGGHWSRFATFAPRPATLLAYLQGRGDPAQRIGHNPLGALSVFALLAVLIAQVSTGLMADDAITFTGPLASLVPGAWSSFATDWHKAQGQWLVIALVVLHVLAVLVYVLVKRQTLIRPMLSGDKQLPALRSQPAALRPSRDDWKTRTGALLLFALCAAVARWVASMQA